MLGGGSAVCSIPGQAQTAKSQSLGPVLTPAAAAVAPTTNQQFLGRDTTCL